MQTSGTSKQNLIRTEESLAEVKKYKEQFLEQKQSLTKLISDEISVLKEINDYSSGSVARRNAQLQLEHALETQTTIKKELDNTMIALKNAEKEAQLKIEQLQKEIVKENQVKEEKTNE